LISGETTIVQSAFLWMMAVPFPVRRKDRGEPRHVRAVMAQPGRICGFLDDRALYSWMMAISIPG
jgi:hypothetical protein